MGLSQIGVFPLLTVAFAFLAFMSGYAIAVGNNHVDAWIPFISDCGALAPERMIFGQLLNMSAFALMVTVYLTHRNILSFYEDHEEDIGKWKHFSVFCVFLGWLSAIGASLVANFAENEQIIVHEIGAFGFFVLIVFYFWGLLIISYSLRPKIVPIHLTNLRLLLTFSMSILLIFHTICLFVEPFVTRTDGKLPERPDWPNAIERPNATSPFYTNHVASCVSEWALALLIMLGILSFSFEFTDTVYHAPRLTRRRADNDSNDTVIINQKAETRLTSQYGIDAYNSVHIPPPILIPDHYSETTSHRRLPRVDKVFPGGTVYSARGMMTSAANNGTTYSGYQHY